MGDDDSTYCVCRNHESHWVFAPEIVGLLNAVSNTVVELFIAVVPLLVFDAAFIIEAEGASLSSKSKSPYGLSITLEI